MAQAIPSATDLMQALQFDDNDLQANRRGQLGQNQRLRLQAMQKRALSFGAGSFLGVGLLATAFLYFAGRNDSIILTLLGILLTLVNALVVGLFGRQWMKLGSDIRTAQIRVISGEMERVVKADGKMNNFVLRVDGEDFHVNKDTFKLFRHEVPYHLYCSLHSRVLIAAEPDA